MTLKTNLLNEITRLYPDMKSNLAERYVNKYISAVLKELRLAILRPDNENDELSFNATQFNTDCGRMKYNNQTIWLSAFMNRSEHTRLINEKFRGQLGKYKRVVLNPIYKELIMQALIAPELYDEPTNALTTQEIDELQQQANKIIPVDIASIQAFIEQSQQTLVTAKKDSDYYLKVYQNIIFAQEIQRIAIESQGQHYVYEAWVTADTGRDYGRFNSLQRLPKAVRHAALGHCHKYDFQAHSFAVMASIAKMLDPTLKIAAVEDYIKYRTAYRERIAREIGVHPETIKRVFTALGFGAKPIRNPYNAIRKLFFTDAKYDALINQQDFKYITEDMAKINKTILEYQTFAGDQFQGFNGYNYVAQREGEKRRNANQKLAWIYQNAESAITRQLIEYVKTHMDQEPLLTVHDCVYYKQKLPSSIFIDAQVSLRMDHQFQYIKLEHEDVYPITTDAAYQDRFAAQEREEQLHRETIMQEEKLARDYASPWTTTQEYKPQSRLDKIIAGTQTDDYSDESYAIYGYDRDNDPFFD